MKRSDASFHESLAEEEEDQSCEDDADKAGEASLDMVRGSSCACNLCYKEQRGYSRLVAYYVLCMTFVFFYLQICFSREMDENESCCGHAAGTPNLGEAIHL